MNESSSSLSVSQKDLTFGRRLSMKLDVVRRTCTDIIIEPSHATAGTNCEPSTADESVGCSSTSDPCLMTKPCKRCSLTPSQLQRQKQLAAEYHRRSTMSAAASFADGHQSKTKNNPSHSDFYPNASDRKLIQENIAATRQIMDLKLQLADLMSKNDTLEHENRQLFDAKSRLETDRDDLKLDLDKAYDRISRLKRERDEAVRDLTRARMLQIREDSRRAKLLGKAADDTDDAEKQQQQQQQQTKKDGSASTTTTASSTTINGSGRSHASSSTSSIAKGSSTTSLNSSNTSGWFRRWNHRRGGGESSQSPTTSRKKLSSSPTTEDNTTTTATNNAAVSRNMFTFLAAIDDKKKNEVASEEQGFSNKQMVLPGRRSSHEPPTQDWGSAHNAPILIRPSRNEQLSEKENSEQVATGAPCNGSRRSQRTLQRKDTESDVNAFFSSFRRSSSDSHFYDGDDTASDESSGNNRDVSKNNDEALARSQSRLPFDDYQSSNNNLIGGKRNATWDDIACDSSSDGENDGDKVNNDDNDDDSINRDESFVYRVVQEKQGRHDSQTLILPGKLRRLSLDSTENSADLGAGQGAGGEGGGGLEPLPHRRSLNACEA